MKQLIFTSLLFCVLASSCDVLPAIKTKPKIKVKNISDFDLNDLKISETDFFNIKKGKSSNFRKVDPFMHEGFHYLYMSYHGKVDGQTIERGEGIWCTTGVDYLTEGKYILEIDVRFNLNNVPIFDFNLIED